MRGGSTGKRGRTWHLRLGILGLLFWIMPVVGCFQTETVVSVAADGSGDIAVVTLLSNEMIEMGEAFKEMGEEEGAEAEASADSDMFPEDDLRAKAADMGSGVTFVSSEKIERDGMTGVRALYKFDDVSKLTLSLNDGAKEMGSDMDVEGPGMESEPPMTFRMEKGKGGNSRLVVRVPAKPETDTESSDGENGTEGEGAEEPPSDEELEMVKQMFAGLRFAFIVEPKGKLVETNSPFARGNQVPVFEMAFDKLLGDMDRFKALASHGKPESFAELSELLSGFEGIAVPLEEEIVVEFEPAR